jgi:DNA gyrase/topoisomerase IV subunit A
MDEGMKEKDKLIANTDLVAMAKDKEINHVKNMFKQLEEEIIGLETIVEQRNEALKVNDDLVASLQLAAQVDAAEKLELKNTAMEREDDIASLKVIVGTKENEKFVAQWETDRVRRDSHDNDKAIKAKAGKVILPQTGKKKDEMIKKQAGQLATYHDDVSIPLLCLASQFLQYWASRTVFRLPRFLIFE